MNGPYPFNAALPLRKYTKVFMKTGTRTECLKWQIDPSEPSEIFLIDWFYCNAKVLGRDALKPTLLTFPHTGTYTKIIMETGTRKECQRWEPSLALLRSALMQKVLGRDA